MKADILFKAATFLDPRFKGKYLVCEDDKKNVLDYITTQSLGVQLAQNKTMIRSASQTSDDEIGDNDTLVAEENFYSEAPVSHTGDDPFDTQEEEELVANAVRLFARGQVCKMDPLNWWSENKDKYLPIVPIARKMMSIPPGSVDSERLFSHAGDIIEDKRTLLHPEKAEILIATKINLPQVNYSYNY